MNTFFRIRLWIITLLVIFLYLPLATSQEFTNFKLTPKFKNINSSKTLTKSLPSYGPQTITDAINQNGSSIYDSIINFIIPNYQNIGTSQATSILHHNEQFNLGTQNHSGFTWQKPMGNFYIGVDRQLEPDLFDDIRWIIKDKFIININAYTYLKNLENDGLIEISDIQLAAFAGIMFQREFRYVHFANSFEEGLTKEFNKLFLSFNFFNQNNILEIAPYEFITKKDYLYIQAGIGGQIQLPYGASLGGGVLVNKKQLSEVTIQALGPRDPKQVDEILRVSVDKQDGFEVIGNLNVAIDFFNLLKITLFEYEYSYEYSEAEKIYLSFFKKDAYELQDKNSFLNKVVDNLLSFRKVPLNTLLPYLVSQESRIQENEYSKYSLLFWGQNEKKLSGQITISKDGITKTFIRSSSNYIKFVRGVLEGFLNFLVKSLFGQELFTNHWASRIRTTGFEYEKAEDYTDNLSPLLTEKQFSLNITNEYFATKTSGSINKKYNKYSRYFLNNFTTLSATISDNIKHNHLQGPLKITLNTKINEDGLVFLSNHTNSKIKSLSKTICKYNKYKFWQFIKKAKARRCYKNLYGKYKKFKLNYNEYDERISFWHFKDFLITFNKYVDNKFYFAELFGKKNIFNYGQLQAITDQGHLFKTYFNEGNIQSAGIIEDYKNEQIYRVPASIEVN